MSYALVICFPRPPPHPRDMRGLCRAIAGELLQLCDDFMPGPRGTLPQICLTCLSIHTKQEHFIHLCDHKGRYTLHKHCASDALSPGQTIATFSATYPNIVVLRRWECYKIIWFYQLS